MWRLITLWSVRRRCVGLIMGIYENGGVIVAFDNLYITAPGD